MKSQSQIHVVYVLNDNYAEPTCVSMLSMLSNTSSHIHFHIISNSLTDENKKKLVKIGELCANGKWDFYEFNFDTSYMKIVNHVTVETYYRFFLPIILPQLDKVIYLDCDTIVNGDIVELWNFDLHNKAVGITPHSYYDPIHDTCKNLLEIPKEKEYCNAGVLLIDLKRFAKLEIHRDLSDLISKISERFETGVHKRQFYEDQDILNYILHQKDAYIYLPYKFDGMLVDSKPPIDNIGFGLPEVAAAYSNPIIYHYGGANGIWTIKNCLHKIDLQFLSSYHAYKKRTPFRNAEDELKIEEYEKRYRWTLQHGTISYGTLTNAYTRDILQRAVKEIKPKLGNKKLVYCGAGKFLRSAMIFFAANGLYPSNIIDNSLEKQSQKVYGFNIELPDVLSHSPDEFLIVLTTHSLSSTEGIRKQLITSGFSANNIYHVFQIAVNRMNESV